ncbi:MAG: YitT family protein [Eubacterium sp.]
MKKFEKEAYGYIRDMFVQHNMVKRVIFTVIAVFIMGFGISLFSVSGFGVDPFTSMNMNISSSLGIGYGTYQMIVNAFIILFVVIFAHRGLIGVGTLFNMIGVGYSCEMFEKIISPAIAPYGASLAVRICLLAVGIIVLCFSCSLFFTANIGVGPYDSIDFYISQRTGVSYKWIRVATDLAVIGIGIGVSAAVNGGLGRIENIGVGTIITAFMMGPLVNFFSKKVSSKILDVDYASISKDVAFFMIKGAMLKNRIPSDFNPSQLNINSNAFEVINNGDFTELEAIKVAD